ncbi:carbohydrate porin [Winogradskyella aurantiaca]|uniref:carbohydrate porin n=1 Tax=Winogradskyella aurantiaca TaxID=2219558 RepID=UPI001300A53B|nr:carbohydrate porin [Winogradskyella aurantiaca]
MILKRQHLFYLICLLSLFGIAQENILYQDIINRDWFGVGFGSYGRIGVSGTTDAAGIDGRRLNLNNMGSIGGRMEEQDYLEAGMAFHMTPKDPGPDSLQINVQLRASVFSRSGSLFGNSNTSGEQGLAIALPEMYVEAKNVITKDLNIWVGSRLYRGPDIHMADYWVFNDHSGQGFGVEYKNSRAAVLYIASTDTTATVPPYFYLNIKSGTPSLEIRNRQVYILEHDFRFKDGQLLSLLAEYHHIGDPTMTTDPDNIILSAPGDNGFVIGARFQNNFNGFEEGSFNQFAVRYGSGIANGGDGGSSRTWETFGAVNLETLNFNNAYSWHITDHFLFNFSRRFSLNGYAVYNRSKGAADGRGLSETYLGREVFNFKQDFTLGFKGVTYLSDLFHLQTEVHYSQRQDGEQPWYRMGKISIVPTLALRKERSVWSRPHLRFIYSMGIYNDFARDNQYSPFLELVGPRSVGHYFGVRAEWWTW